MKPRRSLAAVTIVALAAIFETVSVQTVQSDSPSIEADLSIDNNRPMRNPGGHAATFSTQGFIDPTGEYFQAQGTNGRSCALVPHPGGGGSIKPRTLRRFPRTGALTQSSTCSTRKTGNSGRIDGQRAAGRIQHAVAPGVFRMGRRAPG